jgi:hypothetical protein
MRSQYNPHQRRWDKNMPGPILSCVLSIWYVTQMALTSSSVVNYPLCGITAWENLNQRRTPPKEGGRGTATLDGGENMRSSRARVGF